MNPNDNIIKTLDYLAQKVGIAIDWSAQNILPAVGELCSRYIRYELITSSFSSIMWLIAAGICIYICYRCMRYVFKIYKDEGINKIAEEDMLSIGIAICATLCCGVLALYITADNIIPEIHDIITCLTLPELQIYEKLAELKNGMPA